jgi:hypothetical protein
VRALEKMELGLYFHIGSKPFDPDCNDDVEYRVARGAWEAINSALWHVPGVSVLLDYHGNETRIETPETSRVLRVELCELGGENEVIDGRLAYGFHFFSPNEISLPLAQALKAACLAELTAAGLVEGIPVSFAKTKVFKEWRDTERYEWAEV